MTQAQPEDRPTAWVEMVEAVLFDMDGTLVDSDAAVERAWVAWAELHGVERARVLELAHGRPADQTVRILRPEWDEPAVQESAAWQLAHQYDDLHDVVVMAGAHDLLGWLDQRGVPWAVVTSADRALAAARLTAAGITPAHLVTVEDVTVGKPDPEGYLAAARALGVEPARCLVVEDSTAGLEAGAASGARTAALRDLDGDLRITSLVELDAVLRRAWA